MEVNLSDISSPELDTWWEHYDLMVSSIKDPNALAEGVCRVNIISLDTKDDIIKDNYFGNVKAKTRSLLQIIEGKVKGQPNCFHQFMAALRSSPDLSQLASVLQGSYDRILTGKHPAVTSQLQDASVHACASASMMSSMETGSDQCDDDQSVVSSHSHAVEQGCSSGSIDLAQVDGRTLDSQDEQDVREVLICMAAKYHGIGMSLGLSANELETIRHKFYYDPKLAMGEVISTWLRQSYDVERHGLPSWRRVVEAVDSGAGGCNYVLAKKIASKHQVRKRGPEEGLNGHSPKIARLEFDARFLKFRPKLADFYSTQPEVPEGTWPPVKMRHYINLALIKQKAIDFGKDYVRQTIHGSMDDVIKDKDEITYEDAFNDLADRTLVILEGRPGCGKTTLMHKLSQDWDKCRVLASHLFILVHFRIFSNRSDVGLKEVLRVACRDFTDEEISEMHSLIEKDSGRRVVFALDGLDEYSPESKDNFLYQLIKRDRLVNSVVIVASRPAASQKFRKYATKHVEVLGFLKSQIHEYIKSYYTDDQDNAGGQDKAEGQEGQDKSKGLLKYLDHHLNVMHMCYLPLHTAMVAYLYDVEGDALPQTETEIYRHFTLWTLIRSFQKRNGDLDTPFIMEDFDDLVGVDKKVFHLILRLAYTATVESKQVFTFREVRKCISEQLPKSSSGNEETSLGLIVIDRYFVKYGLDETYTFIHLTLQEYLSACYISYQSEEEQAKIVETYGSAENFAEVWKYFCGIGKCSLDNFETLLKETKDEGAVRKPRSRKKVVSNTLLHLHCAFESQNETMCTRVVETYDSNISLRDQTLNPSDMTALGYVIANSKTPLKQLALASCRLGPEGLSALLMEIKDDCSLPIETLSFNETAIKQDMSTGFASLLNVCPSVWNLNISKCALQVKTLTDISNGIRSDLMHSLTLLNISLNPLGITGSAVKALLEKLPNLKEIVVHPVKDILWFSHVRELLLSRSVQRKYISDQSFTELVLRFKKIGDNEARMLGDVIKENTSLSKVDLVSNQIGDAGAQAIGEGLKSCPNLQSVDLALNQIGDAGAQAIAEGLKSCTNLQSVKLYNNQIGDAGAKAIGEGLKSSPKLQSVNLGVNQIGDAGAQAIGEGLKSCPNLQSVILGVNQIGDAGAQAIAEGLKSCPNLQSVNLDRNQIGDAGAQAIGGRLKSYPNLQSVDLYSNQIGDAGAQAIAEGLKSCPNLQSVHLWNNSITDASVPHFVGLMETARKLKTLDLTSNKFTDIGESQLREAVKKRNSDTTNYVHLSLFV